MQASNLLPGWCHHKIFADELAAMAAYHISLRSSNDCARAICFGWIIFVMFSHSGLGLPRWSVPDQRQLLEGFHQ